MGALTTGEARGLEVAGELVARRRQPMDASRRRASATPSHADATVPRIVGHSSPSMFTLTITRASPASSHGVREDVRERLDRHAARRRARAWRTPPGDGARDPTRRPSRGARPRQLGADRGSASSCQSPPRAPSRCRAARSRSAKFAALRLVRDDCARAVRERLRAVVALVRSDVDDHRAAVVAGIRLVDRDEGRATPSRSRSRRARGRPSPAPSGRA